MKLKKNISFNNSGFVFDASTGTSFHTNPIGIEIIKMLRDERPCDLIKSTIVKSFSPDVNSFEKDFYDFLNMLKKHKLLEVTFKELKKQEYI